MLGYEEKIPHIKETLRQYLKLRNNLYMKTTGLFPEEIERQINLEKISAFLREYISKSFEGITMTVVVASLEKQLFFLMKEPFTVHTQKINKNESSSKEIGEIDIYKGKEYLNSIRVKDQTLTNSDIDRAFDKMIMNGAIKGHFVYRAALIPFYYELSTKTEMYASKGFYASITGIYKYIDLMLITIPTIDSLSLVNNMLEVSYEMKVDLEIIDWLLKIVRKHW